MSVHRKAMLSNLPHNLNKHMVEKTMIIVIILFIKVRLT